MNNFRTAALAAAACTAVVSLGACSVTATASPGTASAGSTASVSSPAGRFPLPRGAQVLEDGNGNGHYSIVFSAVTPAQAARFYATALPQAGYTIISSSSATGDSWGSFSGTGIWFTGHGYNGQVGALSGFSFPGVSFGGNTVEVTLTPQ